MVLGATGMNGLNLQPFVLIFFFVCVCERYVLGSLWQVHLTNCINQFPVKHLLEIAMNK